MSTSKEIQIEVLKEHYRQCLAFWKREKHSEITAQAMALNDILRTRHNPFVPRGEVLDAEVRKTVVDNILQEFCETVRNELETTSANRTLQK